MDLCEKHDTWKIESRILVKPKLLVFRRSPVLSQNLLLPRDQTPASEARTSVVANERAIPIAQLGDGGSRTRVLRRKPKATTCLVGEKRCPPSRRLPSGHFTAYKCLPLAKLSTKGSFSLFLHSYLTREKESDRTLTTKIKQPEQTRY